MRILYVTTGLSLGGAERQLSLMAGIMAGRGHEVRIVSLLPPPVAGGVRIDQRIAVVDLGMEKGRAGIGALFRLSAEIKEFRPDVVHSHMIHANMLACATRFFRRMARLVCTAHSDAETSNPIMLAAYRALSRRCDVFTHVSAAAADRYAALGIRGPRGIVAVHNGIEWARFSAPGGGDRAAVREGLGIGMEEYVFAFIGRIEPIKGPDIALKAFRALSAKGTRARLLMVGEGGMRVALAREYADPGIHWIGGTDAPEKYIHAADCLVMSSRHEGFGLSLAEAMAGGIEVIASDCAGPREILMDGRYGHIVPAENADLLAEAMAARVRSGSLPRPSYREYSKERFDAGRIADEWLRLYGMPLEDA